MGTIPTLGARLARATFEPDLVLTDGEARVVRGTWGIDDPPPADQVEGWIPFRMVFDVIGTGRRHVMMGASQIDAQGNQNISCIGPHDKPKVQLLGVRGAPGNTVHHTTSYYVGRHSKRVFVEAVDMVSGVGPRNGAFELRRIVTNLAVLDLSGPGQTVALRSLHPWATVEEVQAATGFDLFVPANLRMSRAPTELERRWLDHLDPDRKVRGTVEG